MTTVTVIIPVLNEATLLRQRIEHLKALHQTYDVTFCDGGSDDDTCSVLQRHGLHYCTSSRGRAEQMNTAAALSKSDILLFIHVDTEISSSDIALVKQVMQDEKIVGGRFDIRLSGNRPIFHIIAFMINLRSRITKISTGDQCQFVRRDVFERMGGFPRQPLMEDIAFSKRLKSYGRIACLRRKVTTSSRRWQKHGVVRTVLLMWKLRFLYWLGVAPEKLAEMYRDVR